MSVSIVEKYIKGKESKLVEKYISQLELYKKALEESLQRKVDKTYIYSVYLGKEIEIAWKLCRLLV